MHLILAEVAGGLSVLNGLVIMVLLNLLLVLFLRRLNQSYSIAYILCGILVGPHGLKVLTNADLIRELGELGVILLMFFIGTEIRLPIERRQVGLPLFGMVTQLLLCGVAVAVVGNVLNWTVSVKWLMTFILSLSSSAIIYPYLTQHNEQTTALGQLTTGILLMQDVAAIPMLVTLRLLGQDQLAWPELASIGLGVGLTAVLIREISRRPQLKLPAADLIRNDHDLQVFVGMLLCFGMAWITNWLGLSTALGAFMAGIIINRSGSTRWLERSLLPFRVFFLALFFVAVGLQINLAFLRENGWLIGLLVLIILLVNSLLNMLVFRALGVSWRDSVYAGALLSQLGEFSIVLGLTAYQLGLIDNYLYHITLSVVALSMLLTTVWIEIIRGFLFRTRTASPERGQSTEMHERENSG
ncbi:cation:proton antiporter [Larkinella knui]|uniref:Cation:proton antiporter n=1 Tax=Larkinella knui TaxID=2025310 RepID=A0A3P1CXJ9_9BACT|nr:cation:proton antiporter [Larkinella knui]RRB18157.1 cation:proton antiporter [Larkinella knui]